MRVDSEFTVGIHTLLMYGFFDKDRITSGMVARSIGCNPVIVRKVFGKLSKAGLLKTGMGGARTVLARPAEEITLKDVFLATEEEDAEAAFSMYPANLRCPIGKEIHGLLRSRFRSAMDSMLEDLSRTTLADLVAELPQDKRRLPAELRDQTLGEGRMRPRPPRCRRRGRPRRCRGPSPACGGRTSS